MPSNSATVTINNFERNFMFHNLLNIEVNFVRSILIDHIKQKSHNHNACGDDTDKNYNQRQFDNFS